MARNTPIRPACVSNINAKKLFAFWMLLLHVAMNIMGNATAFSRQSICPRPSSFTEKLLLSDPIHSDW